MTDQNPRKQNAQKNVPKHLWGSARTAAVSIVFATLLAGTANADPQSRVVELFDSVQGVRGQGPINDKGDGGGSGGEIGTGAQVRSRLRAGIEVGHAIRALRPKMSRRSGSLGAAGGAAHASLAVGYRQRLVIRDEAA